MKELSVYIRPLRIEDAAISFQWRNNPKIWRFTGSRPDRLITQEIEEAWLAQVLQRVDEKRFAICLKDSDLYIGNIFLTDINNGDAIIHIFIGDMVNWGKGRAVDAMTLIIDYAFADLELDNVYALTDKNNVISISLLEKIQFVHVEDYTDEKSEKQMAKWLFNRSLFKKKAHLKILNVQ